MSWWTWVVGALLIPGQALAADKAGTVLALLDKSNLEGARVKCDKYGAADGDDEALREACAQAFLEDAETANTLQSWAAFRTTWAGTSWAARALKEESNMALSEAGYDASEKVYLDIATTYTGTEAAGFAMERAATAAVAAAKTGDEAKEVAQRYPAQAAELLRHHLAAFVTAEVSLAGVANITVDPPVIEADAVTWSWAARYGDGRLVGWKDDVTRQLTAAGFDGDVVAGQASTAGDAPPYPLCDLPGEEGREVGVVLMGGGGMAFVASAYSPGCGPGQPPLSTTVVDGRIVAVQVSDGAVVELDEGHGTTRNVLSLVKDTPGALQAKPSESLFYGSLGDRAVVFPTNGGDPWVAGLSPPDGGFALSEDLLTSGQTALPPQVGAFLGLGPAEGGAPTLAKWSGDLPAGAVKVDLRTGSVSEKRKAFDGVGVDRGPVSFRKVWEIDLDRDSSPELIAEATMNGQRAVFTYSTTGKRLFGRIFQEDGPSSTRSAVAFEKDGHTYVAWTGGDDVELLHADGVGITYHRLP